MARNNVAIIGGSAAQLFTGCLLAKQGFQVRVFETTEPFAIPSRTLIVTEHMRNLLGHVADNAAVNEIYFARPNRRTDQALPWADQPR
jgi:2-polyprenyl-6-methoxyphenol hydroxylase-like FAD-dependent oxidoreductase